MPGQYRKGANFEREVAHQLKDMGADTTRSAGSHTAKDVVAVFPGPVVWYVQCRTTGRLRPDNRKALLELEEKFNVVPMLAYKVNGKIKFDCVRSKGPNFHYEIRNGRFVKLNE